MAFMQDSDNHSIGIVIQEKSYEDDLYDRFTGVLLGSAIADALGWVTEFLRSKKQLQRFYNVTKLTDFLSWKKETGGRFHSYIDYIQRGEYSDDTQLTLCTARSLGPDGTLDMNHFAKLELPYWLDYARGAGRTVTTAAKTIQRKSATWNNNFFRVAMGSGYLNYRETGANGVAMRISPIVLANRDSFNKVYEEIWKNSIVTHGHPRAIIGAVIYGKALHEVLYDKYVDTPRLLHNLQTFTSELYIPMNLTHIKGWIDKWNYGQEISFEMRFSEVRDEMKEQLKLVERTLGEMPSEVLKQLGCFERATRGSGTSTVSASIALFLRYSDNYERAITETVNLIGSDTDTIGLMVGGLVGAVNGYMGIPDRWTVSLQDFSYFLRVAKALSRINTRKSRGRELLPDFSCFPNEVPNILSLMRSGQIRRGSRVKHPLFALGWVHEVMAGWIRRRDGPTITLAHVEFDVGQSCWFKLYSAGKSGTRLPLNNKPFQASHDPQLRLLPDIT